MKQVLKNYVYGYLNEYYSNLRYIDGDKRAYKQFKIKNIINYLGLPIKYFAFLSKIFVFLSLLEVPLSLTIVSLRFVKYSFIYLSSKKRKLVNSKIMLGLNCNKTIFLKMLDSASLNIEDFYIVEIPTVKTNYDEFKKVSVFSGLKYADILKSFVLSIKVIFLMKKKYHKRDFLFRSHSSFEYFLVNFFVKRSDISNWYYFDALIDRWAYLMGGISHKTCLIQHGELLSNFRFKKIGTVNIAYYINEKQKEVCEKIILKNKPIFYYRTGLNFMTNQINNGLKNVLLVCNMIFFEKEKVIINDLLNKKINLYVKPHPNDSYDSYYKLLSSHAKGFILLDKGDFPKVDVVVSYGSTLASEYEEYGAKVLRYQAPSFQDDYEELKQMLKQ